MMEKYYDAQSVEDIFETIPGNSCPLCVKADATFVSRDIFKRHFEFKHYRRAVNCMVNSKEVCVLPCRKDCYVAKTSLTFSDIKRSHFHCPFCEQLCSRKASFVKHLFSAQGNCSKPSKARKRNSSFVLLCKNANLIREIEKYPVIYNPSNKLIDENACTEAWKSVAYALNETEESCRDIWEDVKATYYHNFGKTRTKFHSFRNWYESDGLQTENTEEKKHIIEIVTDGAAQLNNSGVQEQEVMNADKQIISVGEQFLNSLDAEKEIMEEYDSDGSPPKKMKCFASCKDDEADMLFFRSMLPDLQRMNHKQKNQFKRNVLQLVGDVLYGQDSRKNSLVV